MSAQLWVISAGKGGVGKTFVTSSLGITLSKLSHRVLLIDFDLSGANLHTKFGMKLSDKTLRNYFEEGAPIDSLVQPTNIPRLSCIQGFWDNWAPSDVTPAQVQQVISDCKKLPFDYVLFDLGAGPLPAYMELFKLADERILITDSEPTAVEKTYRYLESFICYSLKENSTADSYKQLQTSLRKYRKENHSSYFSFRNFLKTASNIGFDYFEQLNQKPVRLIVNSSRSRLDQDLGYSIKSVCQKYYDLNLDYAGSIDFDNAVWQSVKTRKPVLIEKPFTPLAGQFLSVCKDLTANNSYANLYRAVV